MPVATRNLIKHKIRFKAKINRSLGGNFVVFVLVTIFGIFMMIPFVYSICQSLKPLDELWIFPPRILPMHPTLKNYSDLFTLMQNSWVPMPRYIFNTIFITTCGTIGQVLLASMCAYPLAKHKFPGHNFIFSMVVLSLMFSGAVTGIPSYLIIMKLGWIDNYLAVIVPAMGSTLGLYLMKQFMELIPDSILEAAKIDGASEYRIFWSIVMPNVKAAWLTLIVFTVQGLWNMGASSFIYSEQLKTFPYAIGQIIAGGIARAGVGCAVSVIMMIVPILIFILTQSNIMETMANSGLKD